MKKVKLAIASVAVTLVSGLGVSCSDFLDKEPDTELDINNVFTNRDKVYQWLANVYNIIREPDFLGLNNDSDGFEMLADDYMTSRRYIQWDWSRVLNRINGSWAITSAWPDGNGKKSPWEDMPKFIRDGYLFRENVKALPKDGVSEEEVEQMLAEVQFLCAYGWWQMAELYGGIPFIPDQIVPTSASLAELQQPQAKFDDVVEYCDKEMLEAANKLPAQWDEDIKYGHITKVMALTVRARMLLFAASPLVNGNSTFADFQNSNGEPIFNSTYDPQKWKKAADAAKLVIDVAEAAGYELYKELNADGEIDPYLSTYNLYIKSWRDGNHEITFPMTKRKDLWNMQRVANTRDAGGGNGLGVYQGLVDAFFTKNGLPIDEDPDYSEEGFSDNVEPTIVTTKWKYGTGKENELTDAGTYKMWVGREPRFYNAVSFQGSWQEEAGRKYDMLWDHADNVQATSPHDAPQNGYLARKHLNHNNIPNKTGNAAYVGYIYRLGFTYLDYAEAINEADGDRSESLEYVNRIRERAGVPPYTFGATEKDADGKYIAIHVDNTKDAVRKIVRMERRVELCCENNRLYDIRRWMIADKNPEITGDALGMNVAGTTDEEFCKRTKALGQTRVWKTQYYWFPISLDQLEKNDNLRNIPQWR